MQTCPICSKSGMNFRARVGLAPDVLADLMECSECAAYFFDPQPSPEQLARFYSASYFNFDPGHERAKGWLFARQLVRIKPQGNFLDIGCATGFFLHGISQKCGWSVFGVEFSSQAADFARRELGIDVRQGDLLGAKFSSEFFDYIHINNVLEHVLDPIAVLEECRRIIKPHGFLFLSIPNGFNDSRPLIRYFQETGEPAFSGNGHIFFFQQITFQKLFSHAGFDILRKKTGSVKRGMRNIGLLPQKKNWMQKCRIKPVQADPDHVSAPGSCKPAIYYKYHAVQNRLRNIPGLHRFGLDFIFLLRPHG
jgi:2-polyprenyl-3-methyl-5-hydroxy-6-metoxy-1,4-benzoquinol methylase